MSLKYVRRKSVKRFKFETRERETVRFHLDISIRVFVKEGM